MAGDCPDETELAQYADRSLESGAIAAVEAHLDGCLDCSAVMAVLRRCEPVPAATAGDLARPGSTIGRYRIRERVGSGGMGVVYRATDPELERDVALKVLHPKARGDSGREARFRKREAQAMARIRHRAVVQVFDVGVAGEQVFIAMELVEGEDLAQRMERRRLSWREALDVFVEAGEGLAAAHDGGVVHRDFKPSNVLIGDDGRVCVADFGLARTEDAPQGREELASPTSEDIVTREGSAPGTPAYMPPEVGVGVADPRSDQYGFCAALCHALSGALPTSTEAERRWEGVPLRIERVVRRGLRQDPIRRWPSMRALLDALQRQRAGGRSWRLSLGALVLMGAGAVTALALRSPQDACSVEDPVAAVWNEETRARLRSVFVETGAPSAEEIAARVATRLDAKAAAWKSTEEAWCDYDAARRACMIANRRSFAALVEGLLNADEDVVYAASAAVRDLAAPGQCEQPGGATDDAPTGVRDVIGRAEVLASLGRYAEARRILGALRENNELTWAGRWAAEVDLIQGRTARRAGDVGVAQEFLEAAYHEATRVGDEETATLAAIERVLCSGSTAASMRRGEQWSKRARASLDRLGDRPEYEVSFYIALARLHEQGTQHDDALQAYESALPWAERQDDPLTTAKLRVFLGLKRSAIGDREAGLALVSESVPVLERELGAGHPEVLKARSMLGKLLLRRGQTERAIALIEESVAGLEGALRPGSVELGVLYQVLASAYLKGPSPNSEAAKRAATKALEILAEATPQRPLETVHVMLTLAQAHQHAGQHDRALQLARKAEVLAQSEGGEDHVLLNGVALVTGKSLNAQGEFARAAELLEPTLERLTARHQKSRLLAGVRIELARALLELGRPREALVHAEAALLRLREPSSLGRARWLSARALAQLGRRQEALAEARVALELLDDSEQKTVAEIRRFIAKSPAK